MPQAACRMVAKDPVEELAHRQMTVQELAEWLHNVTEACAGAAEACGNLHLGPAAEHGPIQGDRIGVDASTIEANAALRTIVRRDSGQDYLQPVTVRGAYLDVDPLAHAEASGIQLARGIL